MNHSRGSLPETTTPLGRAADEIERLKAVNSQQDRQITLLVDRLDKADRTVQELRKHLQWALPKLERKGSTWYLMSLRDAIKAAWPKQD